MQAAQKPYLPNITYWLLVGVDKTHNGSFYRYDLLGKYIHGKFEFRNKDAKDGYIFREELPFHMRLPESETESDTESE
jgi:hypothetical protein